MGVAQPAADRGAGHEVLLSGLCVGRGGGASYLAAIVATFTIHAMICPPNVFTWRQHGRQTQLY